MKVKVGQVWSYGDVLHNLHTKELIMDIKKDIALLKTIEMGPNVNTSYYFLGNRSTINIQYLNSTFNWRLDREYEFYKQLVNLR